MVYKNILLLFFLAFSLMITSCKDDQDNIIIKVKNDVPDELGNLINKVYPENNSIVFFFFSPAVKFNYPIDKVFQLEYEGALRNYRISYLASFVRKSSSTGTFETPPFKYVIVSQDSLVLHQQQSYGGGTYELTLTAILEIEEDGVWRNALRNNQVLSNKLTISFFVSDWYSGQNVEFSEKTPKVNNLVIASKPIIIELNHKVNEEIPVPLNYSEKLVIDYFWVRDDVTGDLVPGDIITDGKQIFFYSNDIEPGKNYTVSIRVKWQYSDGTIWRSSDKNFDFNFKFSTLLAYNPNDYRVEYSYPCLYQYHFLKSEWDKGYIKFSILPIGLIASEIGNIYDVVAMLTDISAGENLLIPLTFQKDSLFFIYDIPSVFLDNEKLYKISLHKNETGSISTEVYSYYFRTSKFNTFLSKMSSMVHTSSSISPILTGVHRLNYLMANNQEAFDFWEGRAKKTSGIEHNVGLVTIENKLEESSWFNVNSITRLYQYVEQYPQAITWRSLNFFGVRPRYNTAKIFTNNGGHPGYLTTELIQEGAPNIAPPNHTLIYNYIALIANQDNYYINSYFSYNNLTPPNLSVFWFLGHSLEFKVRYTLPGINNTTTSLDYTFTY
jgi:hypothetical protein